MRVFVFGAAAFLAAAGLVLPSRVPANDLADRLAPCLACHGEKGTSTIADVPSLGGQPASFLLIQLYQFREKQRIAPPMNDLSAGLTDDDLRAFSDELAKLPPPVPSAEPADPALIEAGRVAAGRHRCGSCHSPDMAGQNQIGRIGAQREDYLVKALTEYKSGERRGYDPAMIEIAKAMSPAEIGAVAHYLARWR